MLSNILVISYYSYFLVYMCCINFSLSKVIITTISGREHIIFPSLMPWTTVTAYLG